MVAMNSYNSTYIILRVVSGILAIMAFVVVAFRFFYMHGIGSGTVVEALGLVFPLTIGMFCAYMAIKGKMPFSKHEQQDPRGKS